MGQYTLTGRVLSYFALCGPRELERVRKGPEGSVCEFEYVYLGVRGSETEGTEVHPRGRRESARERESDRENERGEKVREREMERGMDLKEASEGCRQPWVCAAVVDHIRAQLVAHRIR
eukprot:2632129-Rhodomonas_salina.2